MFTQNWIFHFQHSSTLWLGRDYEQAFLPKGKESSLLKCRYSWEVQPTMCPPGEGPLPFWVTGAGKWAAMNYIPLCTCGGILMPSHTANYFPQKDNIHQRMTCLDSKPSFLFSLVLQVCSQQSLCRNNAFKLPTWFVGSPLAGAPVIHW